MNEPIIFLIPAYNPGDGLIELVQELKVATNYPIVVVNDGSSDSCAFIFKQVQRDGASILSHAVNLGKGAALKTGINHIACEYPNYIGIVTLDADGQHSVKDAIKIADKLISNSASLIVGCREFSSDIPFRSRLGNVVTRNVMNIVGGLKLTDTQSGLRGIPAFFALDLLQLTTTGYDFELDMLLRTRSKGINIIEVPIATIYINGNASSHFSPFWDSVKIYMVFVRFNLSSLLSLIIDYSVFFGLFTLFGNLALSQFTARACAGAVNYFVNRTFVFKSKRRHRVTLTLYILGLALFGFLSYGAIYTLCEYTSVDVFFAKVFVELLLYVAGFLIQREIIFKPSDGLERSKSP